MTEIHVTAGKTILQGYLKTPPAGLCELVWNAFDADAKRVSIEVERNDLGGVEQVIVTDDGDGMNRERAELAFATVGDSWKLMPGTMTNGGRPVHGRYGRGRYAAFSIGNAVNWYSTAEAVEGAELRTTNVQGNRATLDRFRVVDAPLEGEETGTRVVIGTVSPDAAAAFEEATGLRQRLLMEFALHLDRHRDFSIEFLGTEVEPQAVIAAKTPLDLEMPEGVPGKAKLTIIEWDISNVERRLYLCDSTGAIVAEMPPGIQAPGAEFTAYLEWDGFTRDQNLILDGDNSTPQGQVVTAAQTALRSHLAVSQRRREAETVTRWKKEGVYPYKGEPKTQVEKATRDTFNVVAMAASRVVDEAKDTNTKALALSLLRETFENDPERLLPILRKFSKLPSARIDELEEILERTTLTHLISLGHEVGSRVDFLHGLNALLFDRLSRKKLLERRQLHRILAHQTWIFGEEWSLTGDDERLTVVLAKYLEKLGVDVELAGDKPVLRVDGSDAIPDLVLGRRLETRQNHFSHLVVELKRPDHRLTDEDLTQIRSYASAITNDERFSQPNSSWEFWLVGNTTREDIDEAREQDNLPFGVAYNGKKYKVIVKKWAEVIGDAEHRLKFVQDSLQYESGRDLGLAHMRDKYAEYLPKEVIDEVARASDGAPGGDTEPDTMPHPAEPAPVSSPSPDASEPAAATTAGEDDDVSGDDAGAEEAEDKDLKEA